jgi:acyl CoA:acetate/3-ketoacid CoA transferase alpha subunit
MEENTMSFEQAYKEMVSGKKVRRQGFRGCWFLNPEDGILTIRTANGKDIQYGKLDVAVKNCLGNDWEVVEE